MKLLTYLILLIGIASCNGQEQQPEIQEIYLSIAPTFDQTEAENQIIISRLKQFLLSKNNSPYENEFWVATDFDKYLYPFLDIYQMEKSKYGDDSFKPTLMELVDLEEGQKLVKIGFVGINPETSEKLIKCIYNIIAVKIQGAWKFKRALEYNTKDWQVLNEESITYFLPKYKTPNELEIKQQKSEIEDLCRFFDSNPINITYYSCENAKQVFEIKGYDYWPNMYYSTTGGLAEYENIIFSGNSSEIYTHEIVHIYTRKNHPRINRFLDEGIATYIGGSGKNNYTFHRNKLKEYLKSNPLNLAEHTSPYEHLYIEKETPIPYVIGGLICERTIRLFGKEKLFEIFNSDADLWTTLEMVGLTKDNFTEELKKELTSYFTLYKP